MRSTAGRAADRPDQVPQGLGDELTAELTASYWEAYDRRLAETRFLSIARQLPELIGHAIRLAWEAKVPVIPMVVTGTFQALPKHGLVMRGRMDARVEVLEPILPRDFPGADALREAVRAAIAAALPEEHRPAAEPERLPSASRR